MIYNMCTFCIAKNSKHGTFSSRKMEMLQEFSQFVCQLRWLLCWWKFIRNSRNILDCFLRRSNLLQFAEMLTIITWNLNPPEKMRTSWGEGSSTFQAQNANLSNNALPLDARDHLRVVQGTDVLSIRWRACRTMNASRLGARVHDVGADLSRTTPNVMRHANIAMLALRLTTRWRPTFVLPLL